MKPLTLFLGLDFIFQGGEFKIPRKAVRKPRKRHMDAEQDRRQVYAILKREGLLKKRKRKK